VSFFETVLKYCFLINAKASLLNWVTNGFSRKILVHGVSMGHHTEKPESLRRVNAATSPSPLDSTPRLVGAFCV